MSEPNSSSIWMLFYYIFYNVNDSQQIPYAIVQVRACHISWELILYMSVCLV